MKRFVMALGLMFAIRGLGGSRENWPVTRSQQPLTSQRQQEFRPAAGALLIAGGVLIVLWNPYKVVDGSGFFLDCGRVCLPIT
jgi:hypothetical protein